MPTELIESGTVDGAGFFGIYRNIVLPLSMPAFVVVMILVVVGIGSLLGSALLIGAFDSRVHDVDDVARLGLPVLGHVPGFPGDGVGSLTVRGASRARVPSFQRWRSHR